MKKSIIRLDNWKLHYTSEQQRLMQNTVDEYQRFCSTLVSVVYTHWPAIANATSRCATVERLINVTAANPSVPYSYFGNRFYKFPAYLRRAAIEYACGQVSSFVTRYAAWQSGQRSRRDVKPPRLASQSAPFPSLYRGGCIKFHNDFKVAELKVWNGSDWIWTAIRIIGKRQRHTVSSNKLLSPMLLKKGSRFVLGVPFKIFRKKLAQTDAAIGIDLGINTAATLSVVRADGTVMARRFIRRAVDIDRRDRGLTAIRRKARKTAKLSRGFCKGLYRKARHRNLDIARQTAREIVAFAQQHGATTLVFERLKQFRPTAGRKRSTLRQRFHGWLHRLLVERVELIAEEIGMTVAFVYARGSSSLAFDGSGPVKRDNSNYTLATFVSGKCYNADLSASYNIAARYWFQRLTGGNHRQAGSGKSSRPAVRLSTVTLSSLWALRQQTAA